MRRTFVQTSRALVVVVCVACGAASPAPVSTAPSSGVEAHAEADSTGRIAVVSVAANTSLADVLLAQGVEPNGDAYALLYELNPELDLADRKQPVTLRVPVVKRAAGSDELLRLAAYAPTKERVYAATSALEKGSHELHALPEGSLPADLALALDAAFTSLAQQCDSLATAIKSNKHALEREFLDQLALEANDALAVLSRLLRAPGSASSADLQAVQTVLADVQVKATCCNEAMGLFGAPNRSQVTVRVAVKPDLVENYKLRVVAVPVAFKGQTGREHVFPTAGPGQDALSPGNYVLWAVDKDTKARVTDEVVVTVSREKPNQQVELLLLGK